jgi:hypothetical protein
MFMMKFSKVPLFLAMILVLLMTACGAEQGATPTTVGTLLPENNDLTSTPFGPTETIGTTPTVTDSGLIVTPETTSSALEVPTTSSGGLISTPAVGTQAPAPGKTRTAVIPVTGQDIMLVECQFCVDTRAHALLVLPDTATFQITSPAVSSSTTTDTQPTCTTVEINNGRQVVLCSGPELTPLVVNICTDASHCTDFPVDLLACPLTPGGSEATQAPGTGVVTATPLSGTDATATATP